MSEKKREVNYELLRIVAMLMIVTVHYLSKGNVLKPLSDAELNGADKAAWFVEALCMGCVDLYILISGYFGCRSKFRLSKVMCLWGCTIFYSVGITVILGICGMVPIGGNYVSLTQMSVYDWVNVVFPVTTEEYWFITSYIIFYLISPFINAGIEKLDKKNFGRILVILIVILSVAKSILPVKIPFDRCGYDVLWFICLYLLGAYIKIHGFPLMKRPVLSLFLSIGSATLSWGISLVARYIYISRGSLGFYVETNPFYNLNFVLMMSNAVCLFCFFSCVRIQSVGLSKFITTVSGCTLGVYLIHEQLYFKYVWTDLSGASDYASTWKFIPHMILTVLAVFILCVVIEFVRKKITNAIVNHCPRIQHDGGRKA